MRIVLVLVAACGGPPQDPVEPVAGRPLDPPPPADAAVALAPDASAPSDAAELRAEPQLDTAPPPLAGKVTRLAVKTSATVGGVAVTFVSNNHKHPAGRGRALGMWTFRLARGGQQRELELRDTAERFEAEVDAFGTALVFRHVSYDSFEIVEHRRTGKPLTDDACFDQITELATARKLPDTASGYSTDHGIVVARAERWTGHCGTLTGRIWFLAPAEDD